MKMKAEVGNREIRLFDIESPRTPKPGTAEGIAP